MRRTPATKQPASVGASQQPQKLIVPNSGADDGGRVVEHLPDASIAINENGFQTLSGTTTLQLHGLPVGTTLVLLDGRRLAPPELHRSIS